MSSPTSAPKSTTPASTPARRSPYKVYDRARRAAELATPPNKSSTSPKATASPSEPSPSPSASAKRRSFRIVPSEYVLDFQPGFDPKNLPADVNVLYSFRKTPVRYKPSPEEDSPTRQLMEELHEDIRKINIAAKDKMDIYYAEQRRRKEHLDKIDADKMAAYMEKHKRVKQSQIKTREHSDFLLEQHYKEQEAELRRKEAEERAEKERLEKIRLEKEQKEKEERERKERRQREDTAKREAAAEAEKKKKAAEEAEKKARDEAERKKREADLRAKELKEKEEQARAEEEQKKSLALKFPEPTEGQKAVHARYLEIHARLKDLRKYMMAEAKTSPALKPVMGDMRRMIKKCVGQLTEGKGANKQPVS